MTLMMFPTHVGMNRVIFTSGIFISNVPHTRGDEPQLRIASVPPT